MKNAFVLLTLIAVGCGATQPSRFYTLESLPASASTKSEKVTRSVGIGPVDFPKYLDRVEIVSRGNGNEMVINEFDRWAEPLPELFSRLLAEELTEAIGPNAVVYFPESKSNTGDRQIEIQVLGFEGNSKGMHELRVVWGIVDREGRVVSPKQLKRYVESLPETSSYNDRVGALSRLLRQFSDDLIGQISDGK